MAEMHISGHAPVYQTHNASPAAGPQGTPEQHFANHMQEQYGVQVQQHNQLAVSQHAHQFADMHGMSDQGGMAQLNALVHSLMAEIALLKQGGAQAPDKADKPETAEAKHNEEKKQHKADMARLQEKAEMQSEMKAVQAEIKRQSDLDDWILQNLT